MMNRQITKDFKAVGKTILYDTTIKNICCGEERKILFFLYTSLWVSDWDPANQTDKRKFNRKKTNKNLLMHASCIHTGEFGHK